MTDPYSLKDYEDYEKFCAEYENFFNDDHKS